MHVSKTRSDYNAFERLVANGWGRLLQRMMSAPFGIFSSYRDGMTPDQRVQVVRCLKGVLLDLGHGWVDTRWSWRDEGEDDYPKKDSLFVPGMDLAAAAVLGRLLERQVVLVGERGRFSIMELHDDGETTSGDFDLHEALMIPDPPTSQRLYMTGGRKKMFEVRIPDVKQVPDPFSLQVRQEFMDGPNRQKMIEIATTRTPKQKEMLRRQLEQLGNPPMPDPLLDTEAMSPAERRQEIEQRRQERAAGRPGKLAFIDDIVAEIASGSSRYRRVEFQDDPHEGESLHYPTVVFRYEGKPPIMTAKSGARSESSGAFERVGSMSYRIPFVAELVKVLPEFEPSFRWGEPAPVHGTGTRAANIMDVDGFVPEESGVYEDVLEEFSKFRGGVDELFSTQRPGQNLKGFNSLYVGPSGDAFLLDSHQHDETARSVLCTVHPDLPANLRGKRLKAGCYSHTDLTLASGIQRIQIYRDGMGVTVEMRRPPNGEQLGAVRDAYMLTPMDRFVAEINLDGELVAHLTSFGQLVHFVDNWDPNDSCSIEVLDPRLAELCNRRSAN